MWNDQFRFNVVNENSLDIVVSPGMRVQGCLTFRFTLYHLPSLLSSQAVGVSVLALTYTATCMPAVRTQYKPDSNPDFEPSAAAILID